MIAPLLCISHAVLPERGEDSFALRQEESSAFLCVADGCGGLGSKRYPNLEGRTGAAIAAKLVTESLAQCPLRMPATPKEGQSICHEWEADLFAMLSAFAKQHCTEAKSRIVGSMQRNLPTTLCAAITQHGAAPWQETCFFWAGDSRGYVLDEAGLHQCTQDDLRGETDPFETLYLDKPLANFLSADQKARLNLRHLCSAQLGVVVLATDGVYNSLPTPMEFEMLLLDTLLSAKSWTSWETKLRNRVKKLAQDDATLLLQPYGCSTIEALQPALLERRSALQKAYITPVRRHKGDVAYARAKWIGYRQDYNWTEAQQDAGMDWRV